MRSEARYLPELFLDRLHKMIPLRKWDQTANTFTQPKPTTFRVNMLRVSRESAWEKLNRQGFRLRAVPWYSDAFVLCEGRLKELEKTEVYLNGEIYVQSLSSMIPPIVLDPKPGERVLDLTAAPGSKTTQMACLMKGEGEIVAVENDQIRYAKLKSNVELQEAKNVKLLLGYGESIGRKYPESFDRVLLDAPCSAEGRFDTREPSSYRYWTLRKVQEIAKTQRKLLFSALSALKPGGVLIYSTCTFAPEENEGVVNEALEKFGSSIELEPIRLSLSNQMYGLTAWGGKSFKPSLGKTVRILPTSDMEGFFIALILKPFNQSLRRKL